MGLFNKNKSGKKQELLAWQNALHPEYKGTAYVKKLIFTEDQLREATPAYIKSCIETIATERKTISSTTDIKTFFDSSNSITDCLKRLIHMNTHVSFDDMDPESELQEFENKKSSILHDFLVRSYEAVKANASEETLATYVESYCNELDSYMDDMDEVNQNYINQIYADVVK